MTIVLLILAAIAFSTLLYRGSGYLAWVSGAVLALVGWWLSGTGPTTAFVMVATVAIAVALVSGVPVLRRAVVSKALMRLLKPLMPRMGETERVAMEAGTVWWDGELFSGKPDWRKLLDFDVRPLSAKERAFLDGPVEELCQAIDDWQIWQDRALPPEIWDRFRRDRFFGMIIPEEYGGLGFSAIAHSAVIAKIGSRSVPAACVMMVPNSLGPAELLLEYGTQAQRDHYLPRLARGEEIPCFALTEPHAGSDAASPRSHGVVCRGTFDGRDVIGIRLNWNKRYITLAPVATLIGLAFRLSDPDGLLGGETECGITCALIPRDLPGIEIGRHHDPLGVPFPNGPIVGRDVFVPVDFIIGGRDGVGQGWRMLMDCLAAGRSISLPSLSVGAAQLATRVASAYATVREQFNMPIGRFEGIEEVLARIGGYTYLMDAARTVTCGAIDAGEKPAVVSAIVKAYLTDGMRRVMSDAMDIQAGAGICRGPNNLLGRGFVSVPLGITVEGANILTRSMIVFGQGAMRCHPCVFREMQAINSNDADSFDRALFTHINLFTRNAARSLFLSLTGGRLAATPVDGAVARHYRTLTRFSACFALIADATLVMLGGDLKRREKISGRMADALAWLYLGSAVLKRFHDDGRPDRDAAVLDWACDHAAWQIQEALNGVLENLPNRFGAALLRRLVFPWGRPVTPPHDTVGARVAQELLNDNELRRRLTQDIFVPVDTDLGLGRLETALRKIVAAEGVNQKLRQAVRAGGIDSGPAESLAARARQANLIDAAEMCLIAEADLARDAAIAVDVFEPDAYRNLRG